MNLKKNTQKHKDIDKSVSYLELDLEQTVIKQFMTSEQSSVPLPHSRSSVEGNNAAGH